MCGGTSARLMIILPSNIKLQYLAQLSTLTNYVDVEMASTFELRR